MTNQNNIQFISATRVIEKGHHTPKTNAWTSYSKNKHVHNSIILDVAYYIAIQNTDSKNINHYQTPGIRTTINSIMNIEIE